MTYWFRLKVYLISTSLRYSTSLRSMAYYVFFAGRNITLLTIASGCSISNYKVMFHKKDAMKTKNKKIYFPFAISRDAIFPDFSGILDFFHKSKLSMKTYNFNQKMERLASYCCFKYEYVVSALS